MQVTQNAVAVELRDEMNQSKSIYDFKSKTEEEPTNDWMVMKTENEK